MSSENKKHKELSKLNKIGKWIFIAGLLTLLLGLLLLFLTTVDFSGYIIILSIVINVVGITLLTTKTSQC